MTHGELIDEVARLRQALDVKGALFRGAIGERDAALAEVSRLRGLWESLDHTIKAVRSYQNTKGGQTVGPPHLLSLLHVPSVMHELEWLCREGTR